MNTNENTPKSVMAKKAKRHRTFVILGVIIAFLIVCLFTPVFGITSITVKNNRVVDSEAVIRASGIELGDNVFRLNTRDAEESISALGHVESAEIKRKFPARIVIEVKENSESAYVIYMGNYISVDTTGKIIDVLKGDNIDPSKPVISGMAVKDVKKGKIIKATKAEKSDFAIEILRSAEKNKLFSQIKKINISDIKSAKLTLDTDTTVILGDNTQIDYKFAYLIEVLKNLENLRGGEIDLTDTKNVIYKGGK